MRIGWMLLAVVVMACGCELNVASDDHSERADDHSQGQDNSTTTLVAPAEEDTNMVDGVLLRDIDAGRAL